MDHPLVQVNSADMKAIEGGDRRRDQEKRPGGGNRHVAGGTDFEPAVLTVS